MHSAKNAKKNNVSLVFLWINCEKFVFSCNIRKSVPYLNLCALCAGFQPVEYALMEIKFRFPAFDKICSNTIVTKSPAI
jgi:hypothetical protein